MISTWGAWVPSAGGGENALKPLPAVSVFELALPNGMNEVLIQESKESDRVEAKTYPTPTALGPVVDRHGIRGPAGWMVEIPATAY